MPATARLSPMGSADAVNCGGLNGTAVSRGGGTLTGFSTVRFGSRRVRRCY